MPRSETALATIGSGKSLADLLHAWKPSIAQLMENEARAGQLLQMAIAVVRRRPDLAECTATSFRAALEDAAVLGLLPTGLMNLGHIVAFRNKSGSKDATFIAGYRGLVDIVYRSKKIAGLDVALVHVDDGWEYSRGLSTVLRHDPRFTGVFTYDKRTELQCGYVTWWDVIDGAKVAQRHVVLNFEQLERIRRKSKKADDGPWHDDYEPMVYKALIRFATKTMALTPETDALLDRAFSAEDAKLGLKDPAIDVEVEIPPDGRAPTKIEEPFPEA